MGGGGSTRRGVRGCRCHRGPPAGETGRPGLEPGGARVRAEHPHAPRERVAGGRGQPRCGDTRRQLRLVRAGSQRRRGRLVPRAVIVFLYVVVFRDLFLCKNIYLCKSPDFHHLGQSTISGGWMNILRLLTLILPPLFFFPNRPPHGPYGSSPTCGRINILYERKICVSDRMAEFGLITCGSTCQ